MMTFIWMIVGVISIVSACYQFAGLSAAMRKGNLPVTGISLLALLAFLFTAFGGKNPWILLVVAIVTGIAGMTILRRSTRNANHAGESVKLSAAHMALIGGSLMVMIPFAWLLSTSLKTDDEQAVFPPVWIPTQQITSPTIKTTDGKPAPISTLKGTSTRVAELANLPSGEVKVQALDASGALSSEAPKNASRGDLVKIRHVSPRWENYIEALEYLPKDTFYGMVFLKNSLILTLMTTIGTLLSSSLVAYAFARLKFPGRDALFGVLLATMMIPGAVTMMPQFLIFRSLGWIDTLLPLWVPAFFGSAFNVFLLRQFFMSIPNELEDAAKIDGCGPLGIYWRIMLPLVKPALTALGIMAILGAWNNFQGPLIYLSSPDKMPLAYALQLYQQQHGGEPGLLMAASTLVVLPIIVLFFFTQRYFIEGVSLTGLGGR